MSNIINIENLITRYFNNELILEEKELLLNLLKQNPKYLEEFRKYKTASDAVFQSLNKIEFDQKEALQKFHEKIKKTEKNLFTKVIFMSKWVGAAAAVILISWLIFKPVKQIEIITASAEKQEIQLSDGSIVTLNENSKIIYPKKFKKNTTERSIEFSGEAFFEIEPDPETPFIINIDKITIEVKGTSFNILQDSSGGFIKITVKTGIIEVLNKITRKDVIAKTGEMVEYTYKTNELKKEVNTNLNYNSWKTGILVFRDTPLKKVIEDLNRYYKVNFIIDNKMLNNCKLDTKIENIKLNEVIEMLELALGVKIKKENNNYIILGEGC